MLCIELLHARLTYHSPLAVKGVVVVRLRSARAPVKYNSYVVFVYILIDASCYTDRIYALILRARVGDQLKLGTENCTLRYSSYLRVSSESGIDRLPGMREGTGRSSKCAAVVIPIESKGK
jgi:hypothetical protein